jgi:hypothetical protein
VFRVLSVAAAFTVTATLATAACKPIEDPASNAGLEQMKDLIVEGAYDQAFTPFAADAAGIKELSDSLKTILPDGSTGCVTLRRSRPSDHFLSEVFMTENEGLFVFWSISVVTDGPDLQLVDIRYTTEFDQIKEFLF